MSAIFCSLVHTGMNAISSGVLTPCCVSSFSYTKERKNTNSLTQNLNSETLINVREQLSQGIWPDLCSACKQAESTNSNSLRIAFNSYRQSRGLEESITTIIKPQDVYSLHVSVGNKCNSKCMTCYPGASSLWTNEWKTVWNLETIPNTSNSILDDPILVDELVNEFVNLKKITFLGGEPTINENHLEFLKKIVSHGLSSEIDLGYVTNLTGIDDSMLEIWDKFREINLNVSIDGYGIKNDYIRYPIKWSKIETNLRKFLDWAKKDKVSMHLSLTPSAFNCLHLDEVYIFWYNLLKQYNLPMTYGISLNKITHPMNTSPRITSMEYRNVGIKKLLKLKETMPQEFLSSIDFAIDILSEPTLDIKIIEYGKHFIEQSDKYRNRHIKDYIPELYDELWGQI